MTELKGGRHFLKTNIPCFGGFPWWKGESANKGKYLCPLRERDKGGGNVDASLN